MYFTMFLQFIKDDDDDDDDDDDARAFENVCLNL